MYDIEKTGQTIPDTFFQSDNWMSFCAKFGANFYDFRPESLATLEWAEFAFSCSYNFDILLHSIDIVAESNPDLKRPGLAKIKSVYFDILKKHKSESNTQNGCSICGGGGRIVVVEVCINNQWQTIPPTTQKSAYPSHLISAAMCQCVCSGGDENSRENRWSVHRNENNQIDMDEWTHAEYFVRNCISMYGR